MAGKSGLLERLALLPLFPTSSVDGHGGCGTTKCVTLVRLRRKPAPEVPVLQVGRALCRPETRSY